MRYRSFGPHGTVVSALSLRLTDDNVRPTPETWTRQVYAALECGINCFEVDARHPSIIEGFSRAMQAVERHLVVVVWRIGRLPANSQPVNSFSAAAITGQVRAILARTGLGYLDVALLDDPGVSELPLEGLEALLQLKEAGAARMIGVAGADDALSDHIGTGKFDVLGAPYNLTSGWRERLWLRAASARDMAVIGYEAYPEVFHQEMTAARGKRRNVGPLDVGGYGFLDKTHGWSAEEISLAYALTEPAIGAVSISSRACDRLDALCRVVDRELPPGLSAQIEMARFSASLEPEGKAKARRA